MSLLQSILRQKEVEVEEIHNNPALCNVCSSAEKNTLSLLSSLRSTTPSLLAEIKPKSPSKGEIFHRHKALSYVEIYNRHAQGISVLLDHEFFGGGYNLLQEVRAATTLPILAKEFIIDPIQISLARSSGANAILLIAAALDQKQIQKLANTAVSLGMDIVFEIHNESEIASIPDVSPDHLAIGINNRNLASLDINLDTTRELATKIRTILPSNVLLSESGIETRADIQDLQKHVDGFLIGTTLLSAEDTETTITDLFS